MKFTPFPVLKTERCVLRKPVIADEDDLWYLYTQPELSEHLDRQPFQNREEVAKFIAKVERGIETDSYVLWALEHDNKVVGGFCIWNFDDAMTKGEVGYELLPNYQGKGLMNECLQAVIDYGFRILKLHTIEAYTDINNKASVRLLEKNGFELRETEEREMEHKPGNITFGIYELNRKS